MPARTFPPLVTEGPGSGLNKRLALCGSSAQGPSINPALAVNRTNYSQVRVQGVRGMRRFAGFAAVLGFGVGAQVVQARIDETPVAYEIAAAKAVPILRSPLRGFFESNLAGVQECATAGLGSSAECEGLPGEADWHYVMLDVASDADDPTVRHNAARGFPREREAAAQLFRERGRKGGCLPWIIQQRYDALVRAYREGNADLIVRETGMLLHFTTDAALPFHTTADPVGAGTGNLRWSASDGTSRGNPADRTVGHRYELGLLHHLHKRFEYEVRVSPERYGPVSSPIDAAFGTLLAAHRTLGSLLNIDSEVTSGLQITSVRKFVAARNSYYERLADRAAAIVETQLEAAALLGAKLIGAAWVEAGSPPPHGWTLPAPTPGRREPVADAVDTPFIGSRHSTVFHSEACSHVKRITAINRIHFRTVKKAREAGRTPCRTCEPDKSQQP